MFDGLLLWFAYLLLFFASENEFESLSIYLTELVIIALKTVRGLMREVSLIEHNNFAHAIISSSQWLISRNLTDLIISGIMRRTSVDDVFPHLPNTTICDVEKIYRWFRDADHYVRINFVVSLLEYCCDFENRYC